MSDRLCTLLLCLFLKLQHGFSEFQTWTLLQYNSKDNTTVNVICQHNASADWTMGASLYLNGKEACDTNENNVTCLRRESINQFNFTLTVTDKQKRLYCKIYRSYPFPVIVREGERIMFPGSFTSDPMPSDSCSVLTEANELFGLPVWILLGTAFLLCLYCLIVTVVFIHQRKKISQELMITYVPMQQNRLRPKKRPGADKNAEYMDMREVHHQVQPFRDMNHNSHMSPMGASI